MTSPGAAVSWVRSVPVRASPRMQLLAELAVVTALAAAVYALAAGPETALATPDRVVVYLVLTLTGAAGTAAAAIVAILTMPITDQPGERIRLSLLACGLTCYAVVVMPFSAAHFAANDTSPPLEAGRHLASVAVLLLVGCTLDGRCLAWLRTRPSVLAVGLTAVAVPLAIWWPSLVSSASAAWWPDGVLLTALTALTVAFLATGMRQQLKLTWRIGLGMGVLASAHLVRVFAPEPLASSLHLFPALRLLGIGTMLVAMACHCRVELAAMRLRKRQESRQAAESVAALRDNEQRMAVRDHEMRNLVAGLSGVSHLLGQHSTRSGEPISELGAALQQELRRLRGLLDPEADTDERSQTDVTSVITRLALLHRVGGARIASDIQPGLCAAIRPAVLAQVVTNVLANCDRHAPNAAVYVRAYHDAASVRVDVHDDGPGVAWERSSFPAGRHDARAGGLGIGLPECAALLCEHGASIRLGPSDALAGACATLHMPVALRRCAA